MKQISRRGFVKATGALIAAPALASIPVVTAQAQNTGDLRVDSNIVFGKGGDIDLLLDVYHPPQGVTLRGACSRCLRPARMEWPSSKVTAATAA